MTDPLIPALASLAARFVGTPLQLGGLSTPQLVLLASDYVTIALALAIAYVAYRGYRRNDSGPMAVIAAGFVLAFGGPGLIFLLSLALPIPSLVVGGITQATEILGMGLVLYGFWMPRRESVRG
jgi:hypothetical protein